MKKLLAGGIAATALVVVGLVFYACNKDKELDTQNGKLMGSITGGYDNPFEQYGIWHNECLEYIISHIGEDDEITFNNLWTTYGVQYFQSVWGADYVPVPLTELHTAYERTHNIVENKQYLSFLQDVVNAGRLNPNLNIQNLITATIPTNPVIIHLPVTPIDRRNNYNILLDYFTFLTDYNVTSLETYQFAYNKLRTIEQEILDNYYALVNGEKIVEGDDIYNEYKEVLSFMSVSRRTSMFWLNFCGIGEEYYNTLDGWYCHKQMEMHDAIGFYVVGDPSDPWNLQDALNRSDAASLNAGMNYHKIPKK